MSDEIQYHDFKVAQSRHQTYSPTRIIKTGKIRLKQKRGHLHHHHRNGMAYFKGQKIPLCYASCSIGHDDENHTLPKKLEVLAAAGFNAIELSMPDILSYGQQISESKSQPDPKDYATLRSVASEIGKLCEKEGLKILMLQPFANFEGWPKDSEGRKDAWERVNGWMSIMEAAGTDMLQVCYVCFLPLSRKIPELTSGNR